MEFFKHLIARHYSDKIEIHVLAAGGDDARAKHQVTAVEDLLATVDRRPIYRNKLAILFDQPDGENKTRRFENFKASSRHRHLDAGGQLFVLPVHGLEEYYPTALRSSCSDTNKVRMARYMGLNITKEDFETHMPVMFEALKHCWANAYQD